MSGASLQYVTGFCSENRLTPFSILLSLIHFSLCMSVGFKVAIWIPRPSCKRKSKSLLVKAWSIGFTEFRALFCLGFWLGHVFALVSSFRSTRLLRAEYVFDSRYSLNSWLDIKPSLRQSSCASATCNTRNTRGNQKLLLKSKVFGHLKNCCNHSKMWTEWFHQRAMLQNRDT